jgi:hypothetical protein
MATPATIPVTPGAGILLDAVRLTVSGNNVVRETMVIADPTAPGNLVGVTAGGALQVDGSAVTQPVSISGTIGVNLSEFGGSGVSLGQQLAAASIPVIMPAATITALTPPTAAAIASAIVSNPPTTFNGVVTNAGTFAVQATFALPTTGATTATNVNTSSSGWTSLVAGSGSTTVRLWRLEVSVSAATNIGLGDGTTIFRGPYYLQAGGSITWDLSNEPWYVGAAGAALEINSTNAIAYTVTSWTTQS